LVASGIGLVHNSEVTDDAADGRPWPVDPIRSGPSSGPLPVPDIGDLDDVSRALAEFGEVAGPTGPTGPAGAASVGDDDRHRFGLLLDHAAERGLLGARDYEVRLAELAAADSLEEMRRIVTDLPVFTAMPATPGRASSRRSAPVGGAAGPTLGADRHRTGPWVMVGMVVAVMVAALIVLSIVAGHLVRSHDAGVAAPGVLRAVSALRL